MSQTIFAQILAGKIPCQRIYEDAHALAFLDIAPLAPGHTLLIPKEPAPTLDVLSDDASAALGRLLPRLCRAVMRATGCLYYNILQNNGAPAHQAVMHVHFHIIPKPVDGGLRMQWEGQSPGQASQTALAARIAEHID